jgi:L-fucose isomerase-like protein
MTSFGYVRVASALHETAVVDRVTERVVAVLHQLGGAELASPQDGPQSPLVVLVATGGTERAILEIARQRRVAVPFEPVVLLTHPLHNSLPAALEALARLQAEGVHGRIVPVDVEAPWRVAEVVRDVTALHQLHSSRLGLVGAPSDWLVASTPDSVLVTDRWGVELVPIDIDATVADYRQAEPSAVAAVAARFAGRTGPSLELEAAAAVHPTLVRAIERAQVDAVTVRCFDYLGSLATSGCVALAALNDAGTVAGCEGDVASAVAMLLVRALLDQPSWMANPAQIDEDGNRILLAHCTIAPSLVGDEVELHTHFESGLGIGLRGRFTSGWVTLLRLGGPALEKCWIAEASIESSGDAPDLCRTQVTLHLDGVPVRELLEAPLGNHLVLFHGRHRARIERWWQLVFGAAR